MSILLGIGLFLGGAVIGIIIMALMNAASSDRRCEDCQRGGRS